MTSEQIIQALAQIDSKTALSAAVEYKLEDLGLIITDDQPYARLTVTGRFMLDTAKAMV